MATIFANTARVIKPHERILSLFVAILGRSLRAIEAGNMKQIRAPDVAPVNWKATQILGMHIAPKRITRSKPNVINANLLLSESKGMAELNTRPSKLSLTA
uniref:Uncharacterized protein n=1 Tax=Opuntia streptacantha TaxID=393608 RepID=A0A7C9AC13_OPUST